MKVRQCQLAQFVLVGLAFVAQQRLHACALFDRDENDIGLHGQPYPSRPVVGGEPELDFGAGGRIAPMPCEEKTVLSIHQEPLYVCKMRGLLRFAYFTSRRP